MNKQVNILIIALTVFIIPFFVVGGCGNDDDDDGMNGNGDMVDNGGEEFCPETNIDISVCDPEAGPFTLVIDNPFFPLVVGSESVLEGVDDEGADIRIEITVLDEVEMVAGVMTRVVEEDEFEDDERVETSRNFFAQAPDGTVCYFGEDVDDFEDGEVVGHEGEWRAGENGNVPGVFMPPNPQVGDVFMQEGAPGLAEDQAEIIDEDVPIDVPAGMFDDTILVEDCNPLEEGARDEKVYVNGIGLAVDEAAELVSFE